MSGVNVNSAASSARTSTTNPAATSTEPAPATESAAEYLDREAELAKAALAESLRRFKESLGQSVDPKQLTKKHPFLAVASAVAAGFAAAVVTIPSKEQQELARLERLHRAMHPEPEKKAAETSGSPKAAKGPWWMSIVHEVIQLIRPLLTAAITAQMAKKSPPANGAADPGPVDPSSSN